MALHVFSRSHALNKLDRDAGEKCLVLYDDIAPLHKLLKEITEMGEEHQEDPDYFDADGAWDQVVSDALKLKHLIGVTHAVPTDQEGEG